MKKIIAQGFFLRKNYFAGAKMNKAGAL